MKHKKHFKPRKSFFSNFIVTPSDLFVNKFLEIFNVYLAASNAKWYDHLNSAIAQHYIFDIIAFDDYMAQKDPNYNNVKCTYKGKSNVSGFMFITEKYGKEATEMIRYLLDGKFETEFEFDKELTHE